MEYFLTWMYSIVTILLYLFSRVLIFVRGLSGLNSSFYACCSLLPRFINFPSKNLGFWSLILINDHRVILIDILFEWKVISILLWIQEKTLQSVTCVIYIFHHVHVASY